MSELEANDYRGRYEMTICRLGEVQAELSGKSRDLDKALSRLHNHQQDLLDAIKSCRDMEEASKLCKLLADFCS